MIIPTVNQIVRRALRFYAVRDNSRRVFEVVLDYSLALGVPVARFTSQRVLHLETGLTKNRVSEALTDLEACRMLQRDGYGKRALTLTPLADWWHWSLRPVSPSYLDREFLTSLIGASVARVGSTGWAVTTVPSHPVVAYATAYSRGEYDHSELFPREQTFSEAVAEVARVEAVNQVLNAVESSSPSPSAVAPVVPAGGTNRAADWQAGGVFVPPGGTTVVPLSSINPTSSKSISSSSIFPGKEGERGRKPVVPVHGTTPAAALVDPNSPAAACLSFDQRVAQARAVAEAARQAEDAPADTTCLELAARVFPDWEAHRRNGYVAALARQYPRATYVALCRAKECRRQIRLPWAWLKTTVSQITAETNKPAKP